MSIRATINRTIAASLGLLCIAGAILSFTFMEVQRERREMMQAQSLASTVANLRVIIVETILYGEQRSAAQWKSKIAETRSFLDSDPFEGTRDNTMLARLRANFDLLDGLYQRLQQNSDRAAASAGADPELRQDVFARTKSALLITTQDMTDQAFNLTRQNQHQLDLSLQTATWLTAACLALVAVLLLALRRVIGRRVLQPIAAVQAGTLQIARGDFAFRFPEASADEIGMLAARFNDMTARLDQSRNALMQEIDERRTAQQHVSDANEELKRAVTRANDASRSKSDFLASMSHEIRTPLNGILGMTQLVLGTDLTPTQREYLSIVADSSNTLMRVINDILDFSKMEAGKLSLDNREFDVRERVAACLRGFMPVVAEKRLELALQIGADVPAVVIGDADRLIQVLVNLIGNAIKFTERGEILVSASVQSYSRTTVVLQFDVRDTGIGIAPANHQRVFDKFSQEDACTTREYGGTGLGLSICLQLVRVMGGELWLDSAEGEGSIFHFTARFGNTDSMREAPQPRRTDLRGVPVLVVDDNATNRRIIEEQLRSRGMEPVLCDGGRAALDLLAVHAGRGMPFALLLLDDRMPDMHGAEVAERIAGDERYGMPRVVMLSSAGLLASVGVHRRLQKPVAETALFDAIDAVLGSQELSVEGIESAASAELVARAARPLRILLAEDQPINQKLASVVLARRGHTVVVAGNGREAVQRFREDRFDVILMDIQMPDMDGNQATTAVRAIERERGEPGNIRIVALTAHVLERERRRSTDAGMDDYLVKPYSPEQLVAAAEGPQQAPAAPVLHLPAKTVHDVFDRQAALRRTLGKVEILNDMARMFISDSPVVLERMRLAIASGDAKSLGGEAHRIKGSAGIFDARAVVDQASRLEAIGRSGDLTDAHACLAQFECDLGALSSSLQDMVARNAA